MSEALEAQLLEAHECSDIEALAHLYGQAANIAENDGDIDAACFLYTQAYVFALEAGLALAAEFNRKLVHYGRDTLRPELAGDR